MKIDDADFSSVFPLKIPIKKFKKNSKKHEKIVDKYKTI